MEFPNNVKPGHIVEHEDKYYIRRKDLISLLGICRKTIDSAFQNNNLYSINVSNTDKIKRNTCLVSFMGISYLINNLHPHNVDIDAFGKMMQEFSEIPEESSRRGYIYILHIRENIYKYGHTVNINRRLQTHKKELQYKEELLIHPCYNKALAFKIERAIQFNGAGVITHIPSLDGINRDEIFTCDNINFFIDMVKNIIYDETDIYIYSIESHSRDQARKWKNEIMRLKEELKKIDNDVKPMMDDSIKLNTSERMNKFIELSNKIEEVKKMFNANELPSNVTKLNIVPPPEPMLKFVREHIIPCVNNEGFTKKMLDSKYKHVDYIHQYVKGIDKTEKHRDQFACAVKFVYGVNCKNPEYKDKWFNIDYKKVSVEDFIQNRCIMIKGSKEGKRAMNEYYSKYCTSINGIPMTDPAKGFDHVLTAKLAYEDIYIKDTNSLEEFIKNKCIRDTNAKIPTRKFVTAYTTYYKENSLTDDNYKNNYTKYDEGNIKAILPYLGYDVDKSGEHPMISGISIIGYVHVDEIPVAPRILLDIDKFISDNLHHSAGKSVTWRYVYERIKFEVDKIAQSNGTVISDTEKGKIAKYYGINIYNKLGSPVPNSGKINDGTKLNNYILIDLTIIEFIDTYIDKNNNDRIPSDTVRDLYKEKYAGRYKAADSTISKTLKKMLPNEAVGIKRFVYKVRIIRNNQ
jgi:hypothetical protein